VFLLDDQPTTCPICGVRTIFYEFVHNTEQYQIHLCIVLNCSYVFLAVEDQLPLR
jgi:hypothetical protein